ncbi:MAG: F420-dependent oxidoreductase, partial [Acidimicrobiales bacterium]
EAGRHPDEVFVLARVEILLAATAQRAAEELAALDGVQPWAVRPDRFRFVGTAAALASTLADWARTGATDGFMVLPARVTADLNHFVDIVVPALSQAGVFRRSYQGTTLREHFGLSRPRNRYATGE